MQGDSSVQICWQTGVDLFSAQRPVIIASLKTQGILIVKRPAIVRQAPSRVQQPLPRQLLDHLSEAAGGQDHADGKGSMFLSTNDAKSSSK